MAQRLEFETRTAKLLAWLESFQTKPGVYEDIALHPIWGEINENIRPYPFSYYGIILGLLELYQTLQDTQYLDKACQAADVLCSLQKSNGQFLYDNFQHTIEHDFGFTVIHNALPSIALLTLALHTRKKKYVRAAKKNLTFLFSHLWNGEYLSGCVNQDMSAAEALALLYLHEPRAIYKKRIKKISDWCMSYQLPEGCFIRGSDNSEVIVPWYDAKAALSYYTISQILKEDRYFQVAFKTATFLQKQFSKEGLYHWYTLSQKKLTLKKEPFLISLSGLLYYLFKNLKLSFKDSLVEKQLESGGYPSAQGFGDRRDTQPILAWNSFMFLYLCSKVKKPLPLVPLQKNHSFVDAKQKGSLYHIDTLVPRDGYVFVSKDYMTLVSTRVTQSTFFLPLLSPGTYKVKLILDYCLVTNFFIDFSKKDVYFKAEPVYSLYHLIFLRKIVTFLLRKTFKTRIFDWCCKILRL